MLNWRVPVQTQDLVQVTEVNKPIQQDNIKSIRLDATTNEASPPGGFRWEIIGALIHFRNAGLTIDTIQIRDTNNLAPAQLFVNVIGMYDNNLANHDYPLGFFLKIDANNWVGIATPLPVVVRDPYAINYGPSDVTSYAIIMVKEVLER